MACLDFFRVLCLSACCILRGASEILVLEPSRLVVEYGAKASANCSTSISHNGMGWEASQGPVDMVENARLLTWTVPTLTHWDIQPICYINLQNESQTEKNLPVTVYKLPDALSISFKNCPGPVTEGETCRLQCDIQNVAPIRYLKVTWYKQFHMEQTMSFTETTIIPVNKSINCMIQPSRDDDGAKYWCEAKLELGPDGPQPPPTKKSDPVSITVHYKPVFSNDTEIIVSGDGEITLNCTTRANPPSEYTWEAPYQEKAVTLSAPSLSVSRSGNYTCTASNPYGKAKKLFIIKPKYRANTTLWAILGVGLLFAALLITVYIIRKRYTPCKRSANQSKSPSPAVQREEGEELVSPVK
ncbi:Fc receptor-like protein 5 isoform X1 [Pangasianodon hypophthalmus]|uniref:Fc receptor-like protein 5 isoform X1 n=1 Tax=Pangasianodon hypophthalmus TaxID=310915 RepID=UPI000F0017A5|nr:Fc receptor-like protein 5 isoform X1 [Pangasianodon hypophthalmus]